MEMEVHKMTQIQELINTLPRMQSGKELLTSMTVLPEYDEAIRKETEPVRLMALSDIY